MVLRAAAGAAVACGACAVARKADPPAAPVRPAFGLRRAHGAWWLVDAGGQPFFSTAVSCLDRGVPRDQYDVDNPAYVAWRHYPDAAVWRDATLGRLRQWGFNTVGGWGDFATVATAAGPGPWFTPVLHVGSTVGAPWLDMWDPHLLARMDREAAAKIGPLRNDPRVIGYYSDNELGWWNTTLFRMTIEHPPTSGQRRRLVALLRRHYAGDWGALANDFEPTNAASFRDLERGGTVHPRAGRGAMPVLRQFLGMMAERYYCLVRDVIRRHDPRALVLGDRYQSFYYPEVARAAAPYVDVISTNLNAAWNDGTFPRFYLDTLHRLTGKPILVSEIYMAANENRTGNRNSRGVYPVVATQAERAAAARKTLEAVARLPYVVGVEWFQYYDEARHGRPDGENFNFGLVDINDRPYEALTEAIASFDAGVAHAAPPVVRPDATGGIPPAPADPFANLAPTMALKHWDRERGFVPPASPLPMADLYACWSPAALHLGMYCLDIVEAPYYRDGRVPKADRMRWEVRWAGRQTPVRAWLGAAREPLVNDASLRLENMSGVDLNVRNAAVLELPARLFGKSEFRAGDSVDIDSTLDTHCGSSHVAWKGRYVLGRV